MPRPHRSKEFYHAEIQEYIIECTHDGHLDEEEFFNKISGLQAAAGIDGVCPVEFQQMIQSHLRPEEVKKSA